MTNDKPKRDQQGRYDYKNDWDRLCVCGHTLGVHCAGSPADCLLYSHSDRDQVVQDHKHQPDKNCGCEKFRPRRKGGKSIYLMRAK
jgi:hypothetical protein